MGRIATVNAFFNVAFTDACHQLGKTAIVTGYRVGSITFPD
jgi:hypothetical protein